MTLETDFGNKKKARNEVDQDVDSFAAPDLSPEEYAEHTAQQVANAFQATKLFEVVEVRAGVAQVFLIGRVKQDNEKIFLEKVIAPVLAAIERAKEVEGHVCKQFLLKNGTVRYGWTISFAANNLKAAAHAICEAISSAIPRVEVTESPLMGSGPSAGATGAGGKKGARAVT